MSTEFSEDLRPIGDDMSVVEGAPMPRKNRTDRLKAKQYLIPWAWVY